MSSTAHVVKSGIRSAVIDREDVCIALYLNGIGLKITISFSNESVERFEEFGHVAQVVGSMETLSLLYNRSPSSLVRSQRYAEKCREFGIRGYQKGGFSKPFWPTSSADRRSNPAAAFTTLTRRYKNEFLGGKYASVERLVLEI